MSPIIGILLIRGDLEDRGIDEDIGEVLGWMRPIVTVTREPEVDTECSMRRATSTQAKVSDVTVNAQRG
jgi:hypothetical protein